MTNNLLGIILSFTFIAFIIILSTVLQKMKLIGEEGSRKLVHIGVSNWWLIVIFYFNDVWIAIIPPIVFIALNYASYKMNLIKSMERSDKSSLGTVYYPISLLILVVASFLINHPELGAIGVLIMGYGDGLAGLIGKKYGRTKIHGNKTIAGSLTMFIASAIVAYIIFSIYVPDLIIIGTILIATGATVIELFTPKDLDNLTVPLSVSLIYYLLIVINGQPIVADLIVGFAVSELVAVASYYRRSLTNSGVLAAIIIGTMIYVFAGLLAWSLLIAFFISSSVITQFKKARKAKLSIEYKKSSRNYNQVIATGLIPAIFCVLYYITKSDTMLLTAIATIAASCSDTWASEIGTLNKGRTISIANLKPVPKGESGGVSLLGSFAALAGAFMIALLYTLGTSPFNIQNLIIITLIGTAGSFIDSILGATLQVKYIDAKTKVITETSQSHGTQNKIASGTKLLNNDRVNLLTSVLSAAIAIAIFTIV